MVTMAISEKFNLRFLRILFQEVAWNFKPCGAILKVERLSVLSREKKGNLTTSDLEETPQSGGTEAKHQEVLASEDFSILQGVSSCKKAIFKACFSLH